MPPPCHKTKRFHFYSAVSFFLVVLFAFGFSSATASTTTGVGTVFTATLALFEALFLELPYEPMKILPFFDFLSPLPIC